MKKKEKENSSHSSKPEWKKALGFFFSLFQFCELALDVWLGPLESGMELLQDSG